MTLHQILALATVQGVTEFLPVSSSAHLVLISRWSGWPDQGLALDVAVHVGTLFAVGVYFWRDLLAVLRGCGNLLMARGGPDSRLALYLAVATLPIVIVGFLAYDHVGRYLRDPVIIGWSMIVFGVLLWLGERFGAASRKIGDLGWADAVWIGLAQILALIPGASRSGIAMTAAMAAGLDRTAAARFALLLSVPTITGAGVLGGVDLYARGDITLGLDALLAAGLSFVFGLASIALMMRWLRHTGFTPYVIYRLLFGGVLLYGAYVL